MRRLPPTLAVIALLGFAVLLLGLGGWVGCWLDNRLDSRLDSRLDGTLDSTLDGSTGAGAPAPAPADATASFGLKPGPGREHVIANCIPCHSTAIIAANHLTRRGWDAIITQMQQQNGMHPITPGVRTAILDYLESAQRPDDAALRTGKQSPWATPLYRPNPIWK